MDESKTKSPMFSYGAAIIWSAVMLTGLGLLIIYSSSSVPAFQKFGDSFHFLRKQAIVAMAGFLAVLVVQRVPYRWVDRLTIPMVILAFVLLVLPLVPGLGVKANGAARWIRLPGFTFQPAEFAKIALILFLSKNLARKTSDVTRLRGLAPNFVVLGIMSLLLMLQPDFGSTFVLCVVAFFMLFVAGLPRRYIIWGSCAAVGAAALAVWHAPYRMARVLSFLDPWQHVQKGGFQIIQSYLGFQNGGLLGLGLGESRQKLYFLPEAHTDFILSVVGEELGLVGVLLVIFTFGYLIWLGFQIGRIQELPARRFLAFGLTALIALQASLNMGVTMGLLPTKGIPLPFVSSGASSLFVFLVAVALLARLGKEAAEQTYGGKP